MTKETKLERDPGTYRVTDVRAAIRYPGPGGLDKTVKSGETASDLPARSVPWLLDRGWIEPVAAPAPKVKPVETAPPKAKPVETAPPDGEDGDA